MGTEQNRFLLHQEMPLQRRKRWGGCLGGLPCFRTHQTEKRIVPSSRIPEANSSSNPQNRPQNSTSVVPSLLAPPSSPISLSNSAIPSTIQSPNCFPSAPSPERPSMYTTGPYAHETQLVSPPVFSTYTTEPSTAPFTPPPELAHLTTPSSPDVPYAHISSNLKGMNKNHYMNERLMGIEAASAYKNQDSNFFCPTTFAQFYLENNTNSGGRLSVSKESDVCYNGYQNNRHNNKSCKQDGDEIEAYRASFGFSADDIVTTQHYVEINDVMDDSLTTRPTTNREQKMEDFVLGGERVHDEGHGSGGNCEGHKSGRQMANISAQSTPGNNIPNKKENIFSWKGSSRSSRKYHQGLVSSDAEIDYRRGRSLRGRKADFEWVD